MREWWLYSLNVTDRTNIVCFIIFMMVSAALTALVIKMKLPVWKFQMGMILLHGIAAIILYSSEASKWRIGIPILLYSAMAGPVSTV